MTHAPLIELSPSNIQPGFALDVVRTLIERDWTISTMESCTSGLVASYITDTEGASTIFPGGYVTYCNDAKIAAGVNAQVIDNYGVYSPECAEAMAGCAQEHFGTYLSLGVTGTTGNIDPYNPDSVEGEVFFCIRLGEQNHTYHLVMNTTNQARAKIKQAIVEAIFYALSQLL